MTPLAMVAVVYLLAVTLVALAASLGAPLRTAAVTGAVVAELMLLANAAADLAGTSIGRTATEPAVHLGYVLASVGLLPLLLAQRLPQRAHSAVLSLACALTVVVVVREAATA